MQGVNEDNRLMDANGYITSLGDWVSFIFSLMRHI
jgi:hypothetical protein